MRATSFLALVDREWKTWWNTGSAYALRGLYAGLLFAGLAVSWVLAVAFHWLSPADYPQLVRAMFGVFVQGQLLLATLLSTVSFARSLVREKERRSIELLILSPLRPSLILLAKTLGAYLGILALFAAGAPVLCYLEFLGGVSLGQVVASQILIAGQLALVGGVSALLAAAFSRQQAVMLGTWAVVLGLMFLPAAARWVNPTAVPAGSILDQLSFFERLTREVSSVRSDVLGAFQALAAALGALILLCLIGGALLGRRKDPSRERGMGGIWKTLRAPVARAATSRFLTPLFRPLLPVRHPLALRECTLGRDIPFRLAWLAFTGLFAAGIVALASRKSVYIRELSMGLSLLGIITAIFYSVLGGAVGVVSDRRRGTFEELLAANVEPEDIVKAKLAGLFLRWAYLVFIPAVYAAFLGTLLEPAGKLLEHLALGATGLILGSGTAILVTVAVSMRFRSAAGAAAFSLFLAVPAGVVASLVVSTSWIGLAAGVPILLTGALGLYASTVQRFRRSALL